MSERGDKPAPTGYNFSIPLLAFLLSRIWVAIFVYLGHWVPRNEPIAGGWSGVGNWWLNPWTTHDSLHFVNIARDGYTALTAPFFPLYPFLLRLAGDDINRLALWGVVLSNAAFLLALICLYRLAQLEHGNRIAQLTVWVAAFFPASPYFSAVYSDSVFFLFFAAALLSFRQKQFAVAAFCGFLAALTRNAGLLIFLGLTVQYAVEFFQQRGTTQELQADGGSCSRGVGAWGPALAPLAGFLVAQAIITSQVGDPVQGVAAHQEYYRALTWPWLPIVLDIWDFFTLRSFDLITLFNVAVTVLALILVWKYRRRQPISYSVMLLGLLLMQLTYSHYSLPRTQTSLRLLSTMVPFLMLLSLEAAALPWNRLRTGLAGTSVLMVAAAFAYMFGAKYFLG